MRNQRELENFERGSYAGIRDTYKKDFPCPLVVSNPTLAFIMVKPFFVRHNKVLKKINPGICSVFLQKGIILGFFLRMTPIAWCDPLCRAWSRKFRLIYSSFLSSSHQSSLLVSGGSRPGKFQSCPSALLLQTDMVIITHSDTFSLLLYSSPLSTKAAA